MTACTTPAADIARIIAERDALRAMLAEREDECRRLRAFNDGLRERLSKATGRPVYERRPVETSPPGVIPWASVAAACAAEGVDLTGAAVPMEVE